MKIEIREWPGNTEILLLDDDRRIEDTFYTSEKGIPIPCSTDAREQFKLLEARLSPPKIGGMFGHLHPYWAERKAKNKTEVSK